MVIIATASSLDGSSSATGNEAFYSEMMIQLANQIYTLTKPFTETIGKPFQNHFYEPTISQLDKISSSIGIDISQFVYMMFLFLNFPLALLFRKVIPNGTAKHLLSVVIGLFYCFFTFHWQTLHALFIALINYIWIVIFPNKSLGFFPLFSFLLGFTYLTLCHLHRMSTNYLGWTLDFTGLQMLITLKIISVTFNVYDGAKYKKLKSAMNDKAADNNNGTEMNESHIKNRMDRIPTPLEYFGFLFMPIPVLSGPIYEMKSYLDFVNGVNLNENIPTLNILKNIFFSMWNMLLFMMFGNLLGREQLVEYIYSPIAQNDSIFKKIFNTWLFILFVRVKYYIAWHLSESALLISGFKIQTMDYLKMELSSNLRDITTNWNISVSNWLKYYVYTRISNGQSWKSTLMTFVVSSLWHGLYPGYYLMWVSYALSLQFIGRLAHRKIRPYFLKDVRNVFSERNSKISSIVYKVLSYSVTQVVASYLLPPFVLLSLDDSLQFYRFTNWIGHFMFIPLYAVLTLIPTKREKKQHSA
ncbi:hypothetical protein ABK040_012787 [Willaertia magna]